MKRYVSILAGLALAALAGCGGGNNNQCGAVGQACCANNACNAAGTTCVNGTCQMGQACGTAGKACCANNTCTDGSTCTNNMCVAAAMCGASGQKCCTTNPACNTGLVCTNGTCGMMMGGNTGDPCAKATDCQGTKATCITKDTTGITWPGGYCTSQCNPQKNDQNGLNTACPGGQGTCVGQGTSGACELACTDAMGGMPCPRQGYSCFQGCEPTAISECDPTKKGSCPQDGGVVLGDGGEYSGRVCVRIGADPVGQCTNGCDVFKQNCQGAMEACYASDDTGEGVCSQEYNPSGNPQTDGVQCFYLNMCDPGFGCYAPPMANMAVCRPYCGGPNNVLCSAIMPAPQKMKCVDLSTTVKAATVGVCGG